MRHLNFQEFRWRFLDDDGAVDLFGGLQASLHQRDGAPPVICGSRSGMMGSDGGVRGSCWHNDSFVIIEFLLRC